MQWTNLIPFLSNYTHSFGVIELADNPALFMGNGEFAEDILFWKCIAGTQVHKSA